MTTDNVLKLGPGDDLRMMQTPDCWPCGAVLALKRRSDGELGLMFASPGHPRWRIWCLNLFDPRVQAVSAGHAPEGVMYFDFEGPQEVIDAGWLVD